MSRRVSSAALLWLAMAAAGTGCQAPRPLGAQCDVNSECSAPLVCRLDRCRIACNAARDCDLGLACVLDEDGVGSCLLEDEALCTNTSECASSLVCRFGRCTNECSTDRDCVPPTRCLVDPLDDESGCFAGETPPSACTADKDCDGLQRCAEGLCRVRCLTDRDCLDGERCDTSGEEVNNQCVPTMDGGPSDGGLDAGMDGGGPDAGPMLDAGPVVDASPDASPDAGPDASIQRPCGTEDAGRDADGGLLSGCEAANAAGACVAGFCEVTCHAGFENCDGDPYTGCEADLRSPAFCGGCGTRCGANQNCGDAGCVDDDVVQIVGGSSVRCARRTSGEVFCWGADGLGQLGDGDATPPFEFPDERTAPSYPSRVQGITDATDIGVGANHACAVRGASGDVWCWGASDQGQLGSGVALGSVSPIPVPVGITGATQVECGGRLTCARLTDGTVRCVGYNVSGTLGINSGVTNSATPVTVVADASTTDPLSTVQEIAVGTSHVCARLGDGSVVCWGSRSFGRLGDGSAISMGIRPAPFVVATIDDATGLAAGDSGTCVLHMGGGVSCFGYGATGQLGDGTVANRGTPGPVTLSSATQISMGTHFACARLTDSRVMCWGRSEFGQTGADTVDDQILPIEVNGVLDAEFIGAGGLGACVHQAAGTTRCWGANSFGQLGDGTPGCCSDLAGESGGCADTRVCSQTLVPTLVEGL